ncbi:MAG TPA: hypothetical protein VJT72_04770 [Pseudonocardiaceae bacterium]|nr:hypothetical protein [Pseudonocardiaceae bacterium]
MSKLHTSFGLMAGSSGFVARRVCGLAPAFAHLVVVAQDPIHGGDRAVVLAGVEQLGPPRGGGVIDVGLGVEQLAHLRFLLG